MREVHEVRLECPDGRQQTLYVHEAETILEAAESAGLGLPLGCLTGACGTCTGKVLDNDDSAVVHRRPPRSLAERHLEDGYVLLCIASPKADCRIAVGSTVQTELIGNPWK